MTCGMDMRAAVLGAPDAERAASSNHANRRAPLRLLRHAEGPERAASVEMDPQLKKTDRLRPPHKRARLEALAVG